RGRRRPGEQGGDELADGPGAGWIGEPLLRRLAELPDPEALWRQRGYGDRERHSKPVRRRQGGDERAVECAAGSGRGRRGQSVYRGYGEQYGPTGGAGWHDHRVRRHGDGRIRGRRQRGHGRAVERPPGTGG